MTQTTGTGLSGLVLFENCTDDELRLIAPLTRRRTCDPDSTILEVGAAVTELLLIVRGKVRVERPGLDGRLEAGDLIGEMSVLSGEPASATVTALGTTELLTIDAAHVPALLAVPSIAARLRAVALARVASPTQVVTAASAIVVRKPPRVRGVGAGLDAGRKAHPARTMVLSAVALLIVGSTTFVLSQRNKSTVVAIDDLLLGANVAADPPSVALSSANAPQPAEPADNDTAATPDGSTVSAAASTGEPQPGPSTEDPAPAAGQADGTDRVAPTGESPPVAPPDTSTPTFAPPSPGIYTYATTGSEQINIAGARHDYPDQTHAVIERVEGCTWRFTHHVLKEHRDESEVCSGGDEVATRWFSSEIEFFGQSDGLTYLCAPPARTLYAAEPGTVAEGGCSTPEGDGQATYTGRYVGPERLDVGGEQVATAHISIDFLMTGSARGESHVEQWLDVRSGQIVRLERETDTLAKGVWGDVRYQEEATFHLVSMTPRT